MANIIKTLAQAVFSAVSPASVTTPATGQAAIGIDTTTKRLFSVDDAGVVTTYGATGEYNDFVNGRILTYFQDFLSITDTPPFNTPTILGSGSFVSENAETGRRGILKINKSTTINSGGRIMTEINSALLDGGQYFESWLRQDYAAATVVKCGFHDALSTTPVVNGAYFLISAGTATGRCVSASSESVTTSYAMTLGAWYKLKITVNASATSVAFEIRDASETVVLSESITTNIPTAGTGCGFVAYETSAAARTGILLIDTCRIDL